MKLKSLSVVLPVYDEEGVISDVITSVANALPFYADDFEIIAVNDGSKDNTAAILGSLKRSVKCLKVITHEKNLGYGAAVLSGFKEAKCDLVLMMDSDGQFDIRNIERLLPAAEASDIVMGYRIKRKDSFYRRFVGAAGNFAIKALFGVRLRDIKCGFKLFRAEALKYILPDLMARSAAINVEAAMSAQRHGLRISEAGVEHLARPCGRGRGADIEVIFAAFVDAMRSKPALKNIGALLFLSCVLITASIPLFKDIRNINADWDLLQVLSYDRFFVRSLLDFHQFPLRSHYFGGGYPLIANPQDGSLNPLMIFSVVFGEVIGLKLKLFIYYALGAFGMYYLSRSVLKYNNYGAVFSSATFLLGGLIYRITLTHAYTSTDFFLIPLFLAFFIRSKEDNRSLIISGMILAFLAMTAGPDFIPIYFLFFLFSLVSFERAYIKNFLIVSCAAFFLGAVKIFPMIELLQQNPRSIDEYVPFGSSTGVWEHLWRTFCHRYPRFDIYSRAVYSYYYLGVVPVLAAILSFFVCRKENLRYAVLLVIFVMAGLGPQAPFNIFKLLWKLPFFHSLDRPVRYFFPIAVFIIALASGRLFFFFEKMNRPKLSALVFSPVILFVTLDLLAVNGIWHTDVFPLAVPRADSRSVFSQAKNLHPNRDFYPQALRRRPVYAQRSWELTRPTQYELMLSNIGKVNSYVNIHLGEYAVPKYFVDADEEKGRRGLNDYELRLNPAYRAEAYFLDSRRNSASLELISPNRIVLNVSVAEPDRLIINQNYDKYWMADKGVVGGSFGLLSVRLKEPGSYKIQLSYVPVSFYSGLAASIAAVVLMASLWRRRR